MKYQPQIGDISITEIRTGRFLIHRRSSEGWQQLGAGHSEQDIKTLTASMRFLWVSPDFRKFYRPVPPGSEAK